MTDNRNQTNGDDVESAQSGAPEPRHSRRNVVKAGAGILVLPTLAATSTSLFGKTNGTQDESKAGVGPLSSTGLQNPLDKYPRPPYPAQEQPFPGLVSKMTPRPDHGETSYKGSGKLTGRKALITGGDSGIGRAAAIAFSREGADIAINYLPAEQSDAQEVVDLLKAEGRKVLTLPGDIRDEKFCNQLVHDAVNGLGGLDLLTNVAGKQHAVQSLTDLSSEQFDATFKTNVYAMFWITKAALPHLPAGSAIINTASIQAFDPSSWLMDYAPTKAAIANFTEALAKQLAPKGIRVNAVAPGPIWTPLQPSGGHLPDDLPNFGKEAPLGRAGQPAELASTYVMLASQDSSYSTGAVVAVTGGLPLY
jgi:NAD(P)-dependent dehydrogenase (short-subunit alcohol dehydrogenase family)